MSKPFLLLLPALCCGSPAAAADIWQYPEAAGKNALFLDIRFASLSLEGDFTALYPEASLDWLPPLFLPFSLGLYIRIPDPNLRSFGFRIGYHINLGGDGKTDLYALYVFECGWLRKTILERYGDSAPPLRWYDFRAGLRRRFGASLCLSLEADHAFRGITIGVSIQLH
jgi:hypothetical protein